VTSSGADLDVDVVVVGTGPTGAAAALALSTYGIDVLLVTQHGRLSDTPRAHITNQRTMEVLRDLGVAEDIGRYATPWDSMGDTLFTTSLAGPEVARIRAWGTGEERIGDYLRTSPCTPLDVAQPDMESVLVRHATTRGARLRFATRYLSHQQDDAGVSVQLEDRLTGRAYTVRCQYLVGADGARSKIADDLGLDVQGTMARAATSTCSSRLISAVTPSTAAASCTGSCPTRPATARSGWVCCVPSVPGPGGSPDGATT
jgi:2,4-dichlorophenol 6-monooxygenase